MTVISNSALFKGIAGNFGHSQGVIFFNRHAVITNPQELPKEYAISDVKCDANVQYSEKAARHVGTVKCMRVSHDYTEQTCPEK